MALSAMAVPLGAPREVLHPPGWMKSPRPYSFIVRTGHLVFLAGLVSRRGSDDTVVPGPMALQTRTVLDNAGVLLKTAGLSYEHVVAARVFITDDSLFEMMNDEYSRYFTSQPPARATAVTGLMAAGAAVEITLIASTAAKQVLGAAVSPSLPLSSAVRTGSLVYLSGVLGNTDANARDLAGTDARGRGPHPANARRGRACRSRTWWTTPSTCRTSRSSSPWTRSFTKCSPRIRRRGPPSAHSSWRGRDSLK